MVVRVLGRGWECKDMGLRGDVGVGMCVHESGCVGTWV